MNETEVALRKKLDEKQYEIDVLKDALKDREDGIAFLREELKDLQNKMYRIRTWIDAYPVKIFSEPDFEKAHKVLTKHGMTLDSISASNMRQVLNGLKQIIDSE